jgi:hypothetical protein
VAMDRQYGGLPASRIPHPWPGGALPLSRPLQVILPPAYASPWCVSEWRSDQFPLKGRPIFGEGAGCLPRAPSRYLVRIMARLIVRTSMCCQPGAGGASGSGIAWTSRG